MSVAWFIVMTSASRPSITLRACLLEPPCDWLTTIGLAARLLPVRDEGRVVVLVELARDVVADVEQRDRRGLRGASAAPARRGQDGERRRATHAGTFESLGQPSIVRARVARLIARAPHMLLGNRMSGRAHRGAALAARRSSGRRTGSVGPVAATRRDVSRRMTRARGPAAAGASRCSASDRGAVTFGQEDRRPRPAAAGTRRRGRRSRCWSRRPAGPAPRRRGRPCRTRSRRTGPTTMPTLPGISSCA